MAHRHVFVSLGLLLGEKLLALEFLGLDQDQGVGSHALSLGHTFGSDPIVFGLGIGNEAVGLLDSRCFQFLSFGLVGQQHRFGLLSQVGSSLVGLGHLAIAALASQLPDRFDDQEDASHTGMVR